MDIQETLREHFRALVAEHDLADESLTVSCKGLTVEEAIGTPADQDYPIQFGKETMVQAEFRGHCGQAFSSQAKQGSYQLEAVIDLCLESDWERAVFFSSLNAVSAALGLADRTIHCKDEQPKECASHLAEIVPDGAKVGLFGLQPRFLAKLAELGKVRCVDLDPNVVGQVKNGIRIEPVTATLEVLDWCDLALVTGSALVNNTFAVFLDAGKPVHVFGTTGAATAAFLGLPRFCHCAR